MSQNDQLNQYSIKNGQFSWSQCSVLLQWIRFQPHIFGNGYPRYTMPVFIVIWSENYLCHTTCFHQFQTSVTSADRT